MRKAKREGGFTLFILSRMCRTLKVLINVFNKTIIPLALDGNKIVIANSYSTNASGVIVYYTIIDFSQEKRAAR